MIATKEALVALPLLAAPVLPWGQLTQVKYITVKYVSEDSEDDGEAFVNDEMGSGATEDSVAEEGVEIEAPPDPIDEDLADDDLPPIETEELATQESEESLSVAGGNRPQVCVAHISPCRPTCPTCLPALALACLPTHPLAVD